MNEMASKDNGKLNAIHKWSRDSLEDTYLRLYDDQQTLKKHGRRQEEKIKRMATKLLRLLNDKKGEMKGRDVKNDDIIDDLQNKIHTLSNENKLLKDHQLLNKHQMSTRTPYSNIQPRINTGIAHKMKRTFAAGGDTRLHSVKKYGHSLLEESRSENRVLDGVIGELKVTINILEREIDTQKLKAIEKAKEFEEDIVRIKQKLTSDQRIIIQENIDVIRLQRDVKEKSNKLSSLQNSFHALNEKQTLIKKAHEQVLNEMEGMNDLLKREQSKNFKLQAQVSATESSQRMINELQERLFDKEKETHILKESNEKLVKSAFDMEKERDWRQKETALKIQIAQLEATVKADVGEKGTILDKLSNENDAHEQLQNEHKDIKISYFDLKQKHDELKDKMNFFTKESAIDMMELEDALTMVKEKKENQQKPNFIIAVEEEKHKDLQSAIKHLRSEHADTIMELEKTRNLLIVQYRINKDYQLEVTNSMNKLENVKADSESKHLELGQLLDIRSIRIKKLEKQLKEIAYGSRKYIIKNDEDDKDESELEENIDLQRGENLLEINISKMSLNDEALRILNEDEPSLFCTWGFYEFELQSTPIIKNASPEFNFTSKYVIKVDDFFLHYLEKNACKLEVHMSHGIEYNTIAVTTLKLSDLLHQSQTRIHNSAILTGSDNEETIFGTLNYWIRLRIAMPQAMRLFKERSIARGYINANQTSNENVQTLEQSDLNELSISIMSCEIKEIAHSDVLPSPYCIYKFFDFDDHMTSTMSGTLTPKFKDYKQYPLSLSTELHSYLTSKQLTIYLFDDMSVTDTDYIGIVYVPMISLAYNKSIVGCFELTNNKGDKVGSIDLKIKWKFAYEASQCMNIIQTIEKEQTKPVEPPTEDTSEQIVAPITAPVSLSATIEDDLNVSFHASEGEIDASTDVTNSAIFKKKPTKDFRNVTFKGESNGELREPIKPRVISPLIHATERETQEDDEDVEEDDDVEEDEIIEDINDSSSSITITEISSDVSKISEINETLENEDEDTHFEDDQGESTDAMSSDGVVVATNIATNQNQAIEKSDLTEISISHLFLTSECKILNDDSVKMLYVAYRFLGVPADETETPFSLPKPANANQNISFNFTKVFHVDYNNNYERRQYLAGMLLPDDPDNGRIRFNLVSEPEDNKGECQDIGQAFINVHDIINKRADVIDKDLPVYDIYDDDVIIGYVNLSIKCLDALLEVKSEMQCMEYE